MTLGAQDKVYIILQMSLPGGATVTVTTNVEGDVEGLRDVLARTMEPFALLHSVGYEVVPQHELH